MSEGKGPDYVLDLLKQINHPLTTENYLGLAYPGLKTARDTDSPVKRALSPGSSPNVQTHKKK